MSFRTSLLKTVDRARALSGPTFTDIRTNQVTIRTRTWDGEFVGQGNHTDSDLVLPARYPVRAVSGTEIEASGGRYQLDDVKVNHITPFDGDSTGYTPEQLNPTLLGGDNVEVIYMITGPHGEVVTPGGIFPGEYRLVEANFLRPFTYFIVLTRTLKSP